MLQAVRQLPPPELASFVAQVNRLRWSTVKSGLSRAESDLLRRVNQGLPEEAQTLYRALNRKRRDKGLTASESQQLLTLTEELERLNSQRMMALAELSKLRQTPLTVLMEQLGLESPGYE